MNGLGYLDRIWLLLLGLTMFAALLGKFLEPGILIISVALLTLIKGRAIVIAFMDLGEAPRPLRLAVMGWLAGVTLLVALLHLA